jgi:hypothetical protein
MASLETTLKRCGGTSLLPPKDFLMHCTKSLAATRDGVGVAADVAEAIRWYRRAQAAGHLYAEDEIEVCAHA